VASKLEDGVEEEEVVEVAWEDDGSLSVSEAARSRTLESREALRSATERFVFCPPGPSPPASAGAQPPRRLRPRGIEPELLTL